MNDVDRTRIRELRKLIASRKALMSRRQDVIDRAVSDRYEAMKTIMSAQDEIKRLGGSGAMITQFLCGMALAIPAFFACVLASQHLYRRLVSVKAWWGFPTYMTVMVLMIGLTFFCPILAFALGTEVVK